MCSNLFYVTWKSHPLIYNMIQTSFRKLLEYHILSSFYTILIVVVVCRGIPQQTDMLYIDEMGHRAHNVDFTQ